MFIVNVTASYFAMLDATASFGIILYKYWVSEKKTQVMDCQVKKVRVLP